MYDALTDVEKFGIRVVALIRHGKLKQFDCEKCTDELRESRNCEGEDVENPILIHPLLGEVYACPLVCVSKSVLSFFRRYDYYEKYPSTTPSFEDINPRYWEAVQFYENFKNEIIEHDQKQTKNKDSNDNMMAMRGLFNKK